MSTDISMADRAFSVAEKEQIDTTREALVRRLARDGRPVSGEAFLRAACAALRDVLDSGETLEFTEEALLAIIVQALIDKFERRKGDQVLARELVRYVGHGALKCDRNKVYRLRKKYDLGSEPAVGARAPGVGATQGAAEAAPAGWNGGNGHDARGRGAGRRGRDTAGPDIRLMAGNDAAGADARMAADASGPLDDPLHVTREADVAVESLAARSGETLIVYGPRGFGTTTLLNRYLASCQRRGKRVAAVDFALLEAARVDDYGRILTLLATEMLHSLGGAPGLGSRPRKPIERQLDFTYFVDDEILARVDEPVVLAFDHADHILFRREFQDDFFAMVRFWDSRRSHFKFGPLWRHADIALATSTHPDRIIQDPNRSPSLVAHNVVLEPFDLAACVQLGERYHTSLAEREVAALCAYTGGHPAMVRRAFEHLRDGADGLDALLAAAPRRDGPFGKHLRALEVALGQRPPLLDAYRRLVRDADPGGIPAASARLSDDALGELLDAGLVRAEGGLVAPWCPLYAEFFGGARA